MNLKVIPAIISIMLFTSCEEPIKTEAPKVLSERSVEVVVYDSCEYIKVGIGQRAWGAHKGNCSNPIHQK